MRGDEKRWRAKRSAIWEAAVEIRVKKIENIDAVSRIGSRIMNQPNGIVTSEVMVAVATVPIKNSPVLPSSERPSFSNSNADASNGSRRTAIKSFAEDP